jgi:hypothetical protein
MLLVYLILVSFGGVRHLINVELDQLIQYLYGNNPENRPKYIILGDGTTFYYRKDEDCYALCEQAKTIQERIPTAERTGGTTLTQCSGESTLCDGQKGYRQDRERY